MSASKMKKLVRRIIPASARYNIKQVMIRSIVKEMGSIEKEPYDANKFAYGVNLIGPLKSATGLGQSFRLLEAVWQEMDIPYAIYPFEGNTDNFEADEQYRNRIEDELKYSINIWHVNPAEFYETYHRFDRKGFDGHYNIAFWLWEVEDFPSEWTMAINLLDEIWTPAEFISRTIRKITDKPVYTVPYAVTAEADTVKYDRKYFGLPEDKFLYLMMYDTFSIKERKNPEGVVKAFKEAFSENREDVGLVMKVNSANEEEWNYINELIKPYNNVYFVDRNLSKIEVNSLVADVDVFVSLHRAEGFGLVMAEAMLNHTTCISTNWSGNTEFMNEDVACMVDYEMTMLNKFIPPYKKGYKWAEPDVNQAAGYMKKLADDKDSCKAMSESAYSYVKDKLSKEKAIYNIDTRVKQICDRR